MSTDRHTNEGNALSGKDLDNVKGDETGKKASKLGRPRKVNLLGGNSSGEKWVDQELVKNKVERDKNGKLGTREGGKFKLWRGYSGKSFDELEDLVPMKAIAESELYAFASVYWLVVKKMTIVKGKPGVYFRYEDLGILFMMKRIEDANNGCLFTAKMLQVALAPTDAEGLRPNSHLFQLTNGWIKSMKARGLIERLPGMKGWKGYRVAMYRVSQDGRMLLSQVINHFSEIHKDIRYWAKNEEDAYYLRRYIARYTIGIRKTELCQDEGDDAFNEVVRLSRAELKAMGHQAGGQKPDYFWDMPDY